MVVLSKMVNEKPQSSMLNAFFNRDIVDFVSLKQSDYELYCSVVNKLTTKLHTAMQDSDAYYKKYTSRVHFAGSHYDDLKITKPDEFDIVFNVSLPSRIRVSEHKLCPDMSDVVIEPQDPGYITLRMGDRFEELPEKADYDVNRTAYEWGDDEGYLLRSKFMNWFKKVVWKALNLFDTNGTIPLLKIRDRTYSIGRSETGPAITLMLEDEFGFRMDVDLVPALKFPEDRWPALEGYRPIPRNCRKNFWLVVPKSNKKYPDDKEAICRTWTVGLQNQESALIFDKNFLKPTIRLIKKLRDTQKMDEISSYNIKTLFLWEIKRRPNDFWQQNPTVLFKYMVDRLYECLQAGELNYFWNEGLNFMEDVDERVLNGYCNKLEVLMMALNSLNTTKVAEMLLTSEELIRYKRM